MNIVEKTSVCAVTQGMLFNKLFKIRKVKWSDELKKCTYFLYIFKDMLPNNPVVSKGMWHHIYVAY